MADVSIGSVSLGMQLDKADLLSQMKDITQSAASVLQNGLSNALRLGKTDMSGVIGSIGEVKTEVKALATMIGAVIEKGMNTGAKDGVAAVTKAVSNVKMPTVKVTATKGDLTNQLGSMVSLLDNTNAQIYTQQQLVDELKRKWAAMGNLGTQNGDAGLTMKQSILKAEAALTSLEGKSDTMAMKTRAMESAMSGFGTSGAQSVEKVVAAATMADKKLSSVGNSGNLSGKKMASGINSANTSVKNLSTSAMSATGMDKRLASIESNVARVTRSVTALGRRFMVLFVGKIITAAFKDITASLTGASEKSDVLKNSLNALTTAGRTISIAVVTAIAPLINIVGPALLNVSEMVRTFANRVAMFFAAVSGQSTVIQAKKTFAAYTAGATSAGNAAEKAQKQMAGFDNLNILASPTTTSSGGSGGGSGGTNSADFETVPTAGSELASKVRAAIDMLRDPLDRLSTAMGPLLGQLQIFWDQYLVPFGLWVIGEGLPALVDVLAKVFTWLNNNPAAVTGIAAFAAACLVLSGISKISVGVSAVLSGLGLLGPSILGKGAIKAVSVPLTAAATGAFASLLAGAGLAATIYIVYKVTKAAQSNGANGVRDLIDETIEGIDSTTGGGLTNFSNTVANLFPTTEDYNPNGFATTGAQAALNTMEELQAKLKAANVKTTNEMSRELYNILQTFGVGSPEHLALLQKYVDELVISTNKSSRTIDDYYAAIPTAAGKSINKTGTVVKTGMQGQNRTYQDYLYGLTSQTKTSYGIVTTTVDLGTKDAARYMDANIGTGVQGVKDSFGGMPGAIQALLVALDATVKTGAQNAHTSLAGKTTEGVNAALGSYAGMPSSVQSHLSNLAGTVSAGSGSASSALTGGIGAGIGAVIGGFSGLFGATKPHLDNFSNGVSASSSSAGTSMVLEAVRGSSTAIGVYMNFSNAVTSIFRTLDENIKTTMVHITRMMSMLPRTLSPQSLINAMTALVQTRVQGIQMFANGGYVGANSPQLAIIGDNKTQGEIITPENAMAAAVAKGIAAAGGGGGNQTIHITLQNVLDGKILSESVTKYQVKKARQLNKPILA